MKAHSLPAAAGWRWLTEALALYGRYPAPLLFTVSFYWILLLLINIVPGVGPYVAAVCIPGLSVGVMNACRDLDRGRLPPANCLFSGFRGEMRTLLVLGGIYLVLTLAILLGSSLLDGGEFARYLMSGQQPDPQAMEDGRVFRASLFALGLLLPLMMAFWFGPMLAAWYRLPAPKALFFSLVACLLNWRAFLVYALSLLAIVILPFFLLGVVAQMSPQAGSLFAFLFSVPLLLVLLPVIFASFFVSYREVFGVSEIV